MLHSQVIHATAFFAGLSGIQVDRYNYKQTSPYTWLVSSKLVAASGLTIRASPHNYCMKNQQAYARECEEAYRQFLIYSSPLVAHMNLKTSSNVTG